MNYDNSLSFDREMGNDTYLLRTKFLHVFRGNVQIILSSEISIVYRWKELSRGSTVARGVLRLSPLLTFLETMRSVF